MGVTSGATAQTSATSHSPRASASTASATAASDDAMPTSTATCPPRKSKRFAARPATMLADVKSESGSITGQARSTTRSRIASAVSRCSGALPARASPMGAARRLRRMRRIGSVPGIGPERRRGDPDLAALQRRRAGTQAGVGERLGHRLQRELLRRVEPLDLERRDAERPPVERHVVEQRRARRAAAAAGQLRADRDRVEPRWRHGGEGSLLPGGEAAPQRFEPRRARDAAAHPDDRNARRAHATPSLARRPWIRRL